MASRTRSTSSQSEMLSYLRELEAIDRSPSAHHKPFSSDYLAYRNGSMTSETVSENPESKLQTTFEISTAKTGGLYEAFSKSVDEKQVISKDEAEKLRESVLRINRPKNPWVEKSTTRLSPSASHAKTRTPSPRSTLVHIEPPKPATHERTLGQSHSVGSRQSVTGDSASHRQVVHNDAKVRAVPIRTEPPSDIRVLAKSLRNATATDTSPSTSHSAISPIYADASNYRKFVPREDEVIYARPKVVQHPKCYLCNLEVPGTILQALGRTYHPECFRCSTCRKCLDNVPFTLGDDGRVLCLDDYHKRYTTACARCHKPLVGLRSASFYGNGDSQEAEYIVRIPGLDQEFHVHCYSCEGCAKRLGNDPDRRCYPLDGHLLCRACHVQWKRLGGTNQPITDL